MKVRNIKAKIPTSLKDIKLSQYQKFHRVTKDSKDEAFINRVMLGCFMGVPDETVKKMFKVDFNRCIKHFGKLVQDQGKFEPIIIHNGVEYGFIPDMMQISVGEQSDVDEMIGDWQKMDKVMAILYRKVKVRKGGKYLIEDYTGKEKPLDLNMSVTQGAIVFFWKLATTLLSYTQNVIDQAAGSASAREILAKNGVGMEAMSYYVRETFGALMIFPGLTFTKR